MIPRLLEDKLVDRLINSGKVLVLYGARQVGKTTLAKKVLEKAGARFWRLTPTAKYMWMCCRAVILTN